MSPSYSKEIHAHPFGYLSSQRMTKRPATFSTLQEFGDEEDEQRLRREKVEWKHQQDEEQRGKMLQRLKAKLDVPVSPPPLYDAQQAAIDLEIIDNALRKSVE